MTGERVHTEAEIVQRYLAPLASGFAGALGLMDDCAVAAPSDGCEFVLKTDAIAAGVHFLETDPPRDIGWKALAVNVSDLAAKGAVPVAYLMSLAFPEAPEQAWLAEFAAGLGEAQAAFGIHLAGGDTDRRPGPVSITPMVIGEVPRGRMVRRGAARPGDILFVSGTLGDAGMGLRLRRDHSLRLRWGLSPEQAAGLVARYLRPQPRLALAPALRAHARASMDLSDGLMKDLGRMCRASQVGAELRFADLPVCEAFAAVRRAEAATAAADLFAGDDYEILAAIPEGAALAFATAAASAGVAVTRVGRVVPQAGAGQDVVLLDLDGKPIDAGATGWDHF